MMFEKDNLWVASLIFKDKEEEEEKTFSLIVSGKNLDEARYNAARIYSLNIDVKKAIKKCRLYEYIFQYCSWPKRCGNCGSTDLTHYKPMPSGINSWNVRKYLCEKPDILDQDIVYEWLLHENNLLKILPGIFGEVQFYKP